MQLVFQPPSGATSFNSSIYVGGLAVRGLVDSLSDAKPTPTTLATYSYNWDVAITAVARPDQGGANRATPTRITEQGKSLR